ncbi:hypothetical protein DFP73DRAFT_526405 [Morchella snyderi]|nr:hypothetical protein DFP73DRAFT_526405 [Morchella snyderi]
MGCRPRPQLLRRLIGLVLAQTCICVGGGILVCRREYVEKQIWAVEVEMCRWCRWGQVNTPRTDIRGKAELLHRLIGSVPAGVCIDVPVVPVGTGEYAENRYWREGRATLSTQLLHRLIGSVPAGVYIDVPVVPVGTGEYAENRYWREGRATLSTQLLRRLHGACACARLRPRLRCYMGMKPSFFADSIR